MEYLAVRLIRTRATVGESPTVARVSMHRPRLRLPAHLFASSRPNACPGHVHSSAFHVRKPLGQPLVVQILFRRMHEKSACVPGHGVKVPCKSSMEARVMEPGLHRVVDRGVLVAHKAVTGTQPDFSCISAILFCRRLCGGSVPLPVGPATRARLRPYGPRAATVDFSRNARFVLVALTLSRRLGASSACSRYSSQSS